MILKKQIFNVILVAVIRTGECYQTMKYPGVWSYGLQTLVTSLPQRDGTVACKAEASTSRTTVSLALYSSKQFADNSFSARFHGITYFQISFRIVTGGARNVHSGVFNGLYSHDPVTPKFHATSHVVLDISSVPGQVSRIPVICDKMFWKSKSGQMQWQGGVTRFAQ